MRLIGKGGALLTALIVIASVILFFALILHAKLRAEIRYIGGKLDFKVKYLFFTVYPMKKKKRKRKRKKDKSPPDGEAASDSPENEETPGTEDNPETSVSTDAADVSEKDNEVDIEKKGKKDKKKKESLSEKLDKVKDIVEKVKLIWGFSEKHLRRVFTHIYLDKLFIDFIIAGEDAHKTAVAYGTVSAALYNVIPAVRMLFPITFKTVDVVCDFDRKEPVYDCGVNITMRVSTLLSAAFGILFGFLANYKKIIGNKSKQAETAVGA